MEEKSLHVSGARIRELRVKNHLKQEEIGEKMGISRQTVNTWEKKEVVKLTSAEAHKLAEILLVSVKDLTNSKSNDTINDIAPEDIYRNIVEGNTEYILIPRSMLHDKYRVVSVEQIDKDRAQIEKDKAQIEKEKVQLELERQRMINDEIKDRTYREMMDTLSRSYLDRINSLTRSNPDTA